MISFSELRVGDLARVIGYQKMNRSYLQRLLVMGFTKGVQFQLKRIAPLGDPLVVHLRGFDLTLRKNEACGLILEKVSE